MSYEEAKAEAIRHSHRRWAQTRALGRQRYVWVHGVLGVGVLLALALCLGQLLTGRFHPITALAIIALGMVVGYLVGIAKWKYNERVYRAGRVEEIA